MTKDPMQLVTPPNGRELFERYSKVSNGFPINLIITAAVNLLLNAIRQSHPTREGAEQAFDELFGKSKATLMNHYDSFGRKKGIFPYNQVIRPDFFSERNKFGGDNG